MSSRLESIVNLILESENSSSITIQGEYWFDEYGHSMYADGDIGDMNHEMYVIQRCSLSIADRLGMDTSRFDEGWPDSSDFIRFLQKKYINDDAILEKIDNYEWEEVLLNDIGNTTDNKEELDCALDRGDAREYAIKKWGWSRVHGNHIEVKTLNADTLHTVARGIYNVLQEEGLLTSEDDDIVVGQTMYYISTYTGKSYHISLDDMDSPDSVQGLERVVAPTKNAATQQVRQMDVASMPNYYKQKGVIGDAANKLQFIDFFRTVVSEYAQRSSMYSWLSPSGEFHPVTSGSHGQWANNFVKDQGLDVNEHSYSLDYMFERGWFRITYYGKDLYCHNNIRKPSGKCLTALIDAAIDQNMRSIRWDNEDDDIILWSNRDW